MKKGLKIIDKRSGEEFRITGKRNGYIYYKNNSVTGAIPIRSFSDDFDIWRPDTFKRGVGRV